MATRKNKAKIIIRCVLLVKVAVIFCPFRNVIMRITINTALRDSLAFRAHNPSCKKRTTQKWEKRVHRKSNLKQIFFYFFFVSTLISIANSNVRCRSAGVAHEPLTVIIVCVIICGPLDRLRYTCVFLWKVKFDKRIIDGPRPVYTGH